MQVTALGSVLGGTERSAETRDDQRTCIWVLSACHRESAVPNAGLSETEHRAGRGEPSYLHTATDDSTVIARS